MARTSSAIGTRRSLGSIKHKHTAYLDTRTKDLEMNKSSQTQARLRRVALPLVVALALSTSLSACGKKGDLAPPPAHDSTTD